MKDKKRQAYYVESMESAAAHLLRRVKALLDYHSLEADKMSVQAVSFSPAKLMTDIFTAFKPIVEKKGLELQSDIDGLDSQKMCMGDAFRIRQIAENLLSNALKFTDKGRIRFSAALGSDCLLHFSVSDSGCGMTQEEQEKVFGAFTRLKSAQGREGVGLGLSITQKLVQLMSGKISIVSSPGMGSTFSVEIPLQPSTIQNVEKVQRENKKVGAVAVAIIDDDKIQLQMTKAMIENISGSEARVLACQNPNDLFAALRGQKFDVLLTDIQMPAMGGFELLKHVRAIGGECSVLPIVAVTARGDMSLQDLESEGFADCLHKPFSMNELADVIKRASGKTVCSARQPALSENEVEKDASHGLGKNAEAAEICDFSQLTAFADGDKDAENEILSTFFDETKRHCQLFSKALSMHDKAEVCRLSHKMLPTFTLLKVSSVEALKTMESRRTEKTWNEEDEKPSKDIAQSLKAVLKALEKKLAQ